MISGLISLLYHASFHADRVTYTPIRGQSWSLNCILNHYFRFILKGISEQTQAIIFILMEVRQWGEELTSDGRFLTFNMYPAIVKFQQLLRD